ncbi:Flp pilus assembly complex ATPase component TadA [Candidatus Saccharibacteria bacterium]|nr:Flp pilus assembly complex ATPase component TadA [Candidatus Saccharibacteria bacterium]
MLLSKGLQDKVVSLLVEDGLVDAALVQSAYAEAEQSGQPILTFLKSKNLVTDDAIQHASAIATNTPYVDLRNVRLDRAILLKIPQDVAQRSKVIPLAEKDGSLIVAMLDTTNIQRTDYVATLVKMPLIPMMTSEAGIQSALMQYVADLRSVDKAAQQEEARSSHGDGEVLTITQDSPISKALTSILEYAAKSKASDIHIEPLEHALVIRMRIDGVLRKTMELSKSIEAALVSRIKIMAKLKIDEHRVPQDGQFAVQVGDNVIDLRIATSPVVWGEQVVIRLLDKSGTSMEVEKMGMTGRALRDVLEGISRPNGMILTSGPTGSGKSTTLYALIKKIKNDSINIVTLEDPVEYKMDGVNQIQINTDAGLTFASGLRSILRQDPDVVMVGEIRDEETANLAVQAALTGHLVFSTLHTNSAAGILPRLLDMGIEPFLIASTLNTVIGQRLVRRVAERRESFQTSELETNAIKQIVGGILPQTAEDVVQVSESLGYPSLPLATAESYTLVKGIETEDAPGGYAGRAGLYETIAVDEDIQKLIVAHATSGDIMRVAKMKGTVTMRQDGILKVLSGMTTMEEVNRVASDLA